MQYIARLYVVGLNIFNQEDRSNGKFDLSAFHWFEFVTKLRSE